MSEERSTGGLRLRCSPYVAAAVCVALALALRVTVHRELYAADPLLTRAYLDDAYYVEMAARMARGEAFDWFLAPLHPWMGARLAGGAAPTLAFLGGMNAVLGALTSGVVALAAGRIAPVPSRVAAAWTAGLVHALAGEFVFHDVLPGQEAALGLAAAAAILAGVRLLDPELTSRRALLWAAGLGLAVGVAALGRGTSLVLLACALPALLARGAGRGPDAQRTQGSLRERSTRGAACALGLVLALAPASLHNLRVADTLSPFPSSGGANLYLMNGPDAREQVAMNARELGRDPWTIEKRAGLIASNAMGRQVTAREASSWWAQRTLDESGGVGAQLAHLARKAVLFWSANEPGSNHASHAEARFATYLRLVPLAGWWLLVAGAGCWWLVRVRAPGADVAALAVWGIWLALTLFFPVGRYRLPAMVASAVLVGAAAPLLPELLRAAARRRSVAALLVLGTLALALAPIGYPDPGTGHMNVALALRNQGASEAQVEAEAARAVEADPAHGPANELLGRAQLARGDARAALAHFEVAARDPRSRVSAQIAALPALIDVGRGPAAWSAAQGLLSEGIGDPELLANAAAAAWTAGQHQAATDLVLRAESLAPGHPALAAARARMR